MFTKRNNSRARKRITSAGDAHLLERPGVKQVAAVADRWRNRARIARGPAARVAVPSSSILLDMYDPMYLLQREGTAGRTLLQLPLMRATALMRTGVSRAELAVSVACDGLMCLHRCLFLLGQKGRRTEAREVSAPPRCILSGTSTSLRHTITLCNNEHNFF